MAMFKLKMRNNGMVREDFPKLDDKLTVSTVNKAKLGAGNLYLKTYAEKYIGIGEKNNKTKAEIRAHLMQVQETLFQRGFVDATSLTIINNLLSDKDDRTMFSALIKNNEELFPPTTVLDSSMITSDNPKAYLFGSITQDVFDDINTNFDKLLVAKLI